MFCALIKGVSKDDGSGEFKAEWTFVRQGEWWWLDIMKRKIFFTNCTVIFLQ